MKYKKLLFGALFVALGFLWVSPASAITFYRYSSIANLAAKDGTDLADGDAAIVLEDGSFYAYILDDDSGAVESSPDIIQPDANGGNKRWILRNTYPRMAGNDDPDVSVEGQIAYDTDRWIRLYADSLQIGIPIDVSFTRTITEPDSLAEDDFLPLWINDTGMSFIITQIIAKSDVDNFDFTLKEASGTDFSTLTTIEAITIATDGTSVYYTTVASGDIDHATIETGHVIGFDNSTDIADYVTIHIEGYYLGDVN